jgi:hypothetical protein
MSGRPSDTFGRDYRRAVRDGTREVVALAWLLVDEAYTHGSLTIRASARYLRDEAGVSGWALPRARAWLVERRLLEFDRGAGGTVRGGHRGAYTLLPPDPESDPVRRVTSKGAKATRKRPESDPKATHPGWVMGPGPVLEEEEGGAHARNGNPELERLLAPLERADGVRLNGPGRDVVVAAYAESPAGVEALIRECAKRKRVDSRGGLLVERVRRGDHHGAGELRAALAPCPECGLGAGRHAAECPEAPA